MKPPDVERVTRKPVEIESLTDNHEKQKKNQDCKLKKEKKRKKQTQREREQSTLRLYTRNTTQQNSVQKAKKHTENTAHFRRLANGTRDWTKTPKNQKIKNGW
jgi:hypothetical protein